MSEKNATDNKIAVRELVITRIFDAPRKLVWKAWTDIDLFQKWWGPKDFTCPVSKMDFRVGGHYLHCMRGPDGQEYWSTGIYKEIVTMEKIVCTDSFADAQGNKVSASEMGMPGDDWPNELQVTVTFEDLGARTKMTLRHVGIPEGVMNEMTNAGWNQSFDKLSAALQSL